MSSQRRSSSRPRRTSSAMNALRRRGPARRSISRHEVVGECYVQTHGPERSIVRTHLATAICPRQATSRRPVITGRIPCRFGACPATMESVFDPLSHARPAARHHPRLPRGRSPDRGAAPGRRDASAGQGHRLHRSAARGQVDVPVPAGAEAGRPRRAARQHPVRELLRRPPPPPAARGARAPWPTPTSPSTRRRRTPRRSTASSTRSRSSPAGSRSSTGCCGPRSARCTSRARRRGCSRGRSRPRCAAAHCRGRSSPSRSGEFLDFEGLDAGGPLSTRRRLLVRKAFEKYWERGGFPEVAGLDRGLRIRIHQEYWGAMLFRDLVERHDVAHPRAVSGPGPAAGGQHRFAVHHQPAHRVSSVARTPGAKARRLRLRGMVRGRVLPDHGARLRRLAGPCQDESEEDLLRRPCAGAIRGLRRPRQLRPSAGEPGVHGVAAVEPEDRLLQGSEWARGGLRGGGGRTDPASWCRSASRSRSRGRANGK